MKRRAAVNNVLGGVLGPPPGMAAAMNELIDKSDGEVPQIIYQDRVVEVEKIVEVEKRIEVAVPTSVIDDPDSGVTWAGKIGVTPVGLWVAEGLTQQEWRDFLPMILKIESAYQWIIGDWAAYGELAWGSGYRELSDMTKRSVETLQNWASVCRNVQISRRRDDLPFSHHVVVAKLSAQAQSEWLEIAVRYKWAQGRLQDMIAQTDGDISQVAALLTGYTPPTLSRDPMDRFANMATSFWAKAFKIAKKAEAPTRLQMAQKLREMAEQLEKGE